MIFQVPNFALNANPRLSVKKNTMNCNKKSYLLLTSISCEKWSAHR